MNVTFGDLKVILWYGWWNGTLFMHSTYYYSRVVVYKGVEVKGKGKVLEILNVA